MRGLFAVFLTVIFSYNIIANDFTEIHIKFEISKDLDMDYINEIVDIYKIENNFAYAVSDEPGFYAFKALKYSFEVIPDPIMATKALTMATTVAEMSNWDRYPTHDVYKQMMQNFAINYPSICRLDTIGTTIDGRPVLVAVISDNVNTDENEPEFLYTGQMHGDEIVTYIMFLRLIDHLLSNYGSDSQIANLINNVEIYINPLSNPDGTYNDGDNTVSGAVRTAHNVDLNRDYPFPGGGNADPSGWATETAMMIAFAEERDFVMSANSHSGAEVINFPYDIWTTAENMHADDNWWRVVSEDYANSVQALGSGVDYFTDATSSGYTQGGDWYVVDGSRQDYMNYYSNCREVTLELSGSKFLDVGLLPNHWNYNKQAMLDYLQEVVYGIRGVVTRDCDGEPVKAKMEIISHDYDNSFVYSSMPVGNYHRPIYPGTYNLKFTSPNYDDKIVNNITVTEGNVTIVDVEMVYNGSEVDFSSNTEETCNGEIEFTLASELTNIIWDFGDGTESNEINPTHNYTQNGTYTVKMKFSACGASDSITKTNYIQVNLLPEPTAANVERCGAGSVTLNATPNSNGTIYWYDNQDNFLQTGTSYSTPLLTNTTQYKIKETDALLNNYVGLEDNTAGGDYYNDQSRYLIFDVYTDLTLKTVKVYAEEYGVRTFVLKDETGSTIYQANIQVYPGENIVSLNWSISSGNNYNIKIDSNNPNLWRNNVGIEYPYIINDVISITTSSAGDNYYYFFYNWEIEYESNCISEIKTVNAVINNLVLADFTFTQTYNEISFVNNSANAVSYSWNFGDTYSSSDENTNHIYSSVGEYIVNLSATNDCGTEVHTDTVNILSLIVLDDIEKKLVEIYPNPANNIINIETDLVVNSILIKNIVGKIVIVTNSNSNKIDVSTLEPGLYIVEIIANDFKIINKIIIQ